MTHATAVILSTLTTAAAGVAYEVEVEGAERGVAEEEVNQPACNKVRYADAIHTGQATPLCGNHAQRPTSQP